MIYSYEKIQELGTKPREDAAHDEKTATAYTVVWYWFQTMGSSGCKGVETDREKERFTCC